MKIIDSRKLGALVKERREQLGKAKWSVIQDSGIDKGTYYKIERGECNDFFLTLATYVRLSAVLKIPLYQILNAIGAQKAQGGDTEILCKEKDAHV